MLERILLMLGLLSADSLQGGALFYLLSANRPLPWRLVAPNRQGLVRMLSTSGLMTYSIVSVTLQILVDDIIMNLAF